MRFVCLTCFGDFVLVKDEWTYDKHYAAGMRLCTGTVVREDDPRFAPALAQQRPYTAEDADSARRFVQAAIDTAAHRFDVVAHRKQYGDDKGDA